MDTTRFLSVLYLSVQNRYLQERCAKAARRKKIAQQGRAGTFQRALGAESGLSARLSDGVPRPLGHFEGLWETLKVRTEMETLGPDFALIQEEEVDFLPFGDQLAIAEAV